MDRKNALIILRCDGTLIPKNYTPPMAMYNPVAMTNFESVITKLQRNFSVKIALSSAYIGPDMALEDVRDELGRYEFAKCVFHIIPPGPQDKFPDAVIELLREHKRSYWALVCPHGFVEYRADLEQNTVKCADEND
jgi:hypothetical protein